MKKYFQKILSGIFILLSINSYSQNNLPFIDINQLPQQPVFDFDPTQLSINPLNMAALSFGKSFLNYKESHIISETKNNLFTDATLEGNADSALIIKFETPALKNINPGFDVMYSTKTIKPILKTSFASLNIPIDTFNILTFDTLVTLKIKLPFSTRIGHFSFNFTPKLGCSTIFSFQKMPQETLTSSNNKFKKPSSLLYDQHFGFAAAAAIGMEYYFSQWIGLFIEYCMQYSHISFSNQFILFMMRSAFNIRDSSDTPPPPQPYSYFTTALTFGIKVNF
jgi:hypothetical protein